MRSRNSIRATVASVAGAALAVTILGGVTAAPANAATHAPSTATAAAAAAKVTWYGPAKMGSIAGTRMPVCSTPKTGLLPDYGQKTGKGLVAKKTMTVKYQSGTRLIFKKVRKGALVCKWTARKSSTNPSGGASSTNPSGGSSTTPVTTGASSTAGQPFTAPTIEFVRTYAFRASYSSIANRTGDWMVAHEFVLHGGQYVVNGAYLGNPNRATHNQRVLVSGDVTVTIKAKPFDLTGTGVQWDPSQGCPNPAYASFEVGAPGTESGNGDLSSIEFSPEARQAMLVAVSANRGVACPVVG